MWQLQMSDFSDEERRFADVCCLRGKAELWVTTPWPQALWPISTHQVDSGTICQIRCL